MEPPGGLLRLIAMSTLMRVLAALAVAAASMVLAAPGASALSCVAPSDFFPHAEHVFVGRIADVQGDRIRFEVEEVWQGDDLPRDLWVPMNLEMWFPFANDRGEVPDGYSSSTRYVVAADADLAVSPCSLAPDDGSDYGVDDGLPRPPVWDAASGGPAGDGADRSPVAPAQNQPVAQEGAGPSAGPLVAGGAGVAGLAAALGALWRRRLR